MKSWGPFMWDLEYLLLFGVPDNKWELLRGRVRWAFPFRDREAAQAHFASWTDTLRRWRDGAEVTVNEMTTANGSPRRIVRFDGVEMSLYPRPIELRMPMDMAVFDALYFSFWRRDLWPGQDHGKETGWESAQRHWDVQHNLWKLFRDFCREFGGKHCGRVAIALNDRNAVEPDQYYFQAPRGECMIEKDYFQGVPRLVAEVLSPATRALDRGSRMDVYRRAGVPHLWLLDPETELVEEFALVGREFAGTGRHGPGESYRPALFPEQSVAVDSLFDTQEKRYGSLREETELEPPPKWLISPDRRVGLEVLFFFGHPEKRYEIWDNRAPCLLAFGSPEEAAMRFGHFLEDICRWEQMPLARPSPIEPGVELAEVGRFRLTRRERLVRLDVAVDARKFRELLHVWTRRDAWDWGGD
jgi:Uma2 family endonuclease